MDVGFIGLGDQGAPMARAIARAGHRLHVWARREEALVPFAEAGAIVHASPADLAVAVEHLGLCVLDEAAVLELLDGGGILRQLRPGAVLAIHSTMAPEACRVLARRAGAEGVDLLDAPVSGGREAAEAGRLLVLVGGDGAVVGRSRPVLSAYADRIRHVGPVGAGQTVKILNNLLLNANLAAALEVLRLGHALGLERSSLREALLDGTAASTALDWLDRLLPAGHPATLARKDIALALALARSCDAASPQIEELADMALRGRERLAAGG